MKRRCILRKISRDDTVGSFKLSALEIRKRIAEREALEPLYQKKQKLIEEAMRTGMTSDLKKRIKELDDKIKQLKDK